MKKLIFLLIVVAIVYGLEVVQEQGISVPTPSSTSQDSDSAVESAYKNRQSDIQVQGQGTVLRVLPDDVDGSRHQRIILELDTGQSLLVAHNIDLAPRVNGLNKGDTVEFYGEYEWNSKGGVIHWTHHDPNHRHIDGWLKHRGQTYQ
ncbi:MAG: DUF3465 domain-containing protein [Lysobacterales bacterium]